MIAKAVTWRNAAQNFLKFFAAQFYLLLFAHSILNADDANQADKRGFSLLFLSAEIRLIRVIRVLLIL